MATRQEIEDQLKDIQTHVDAFTETVVTIRERFKTVKKEGAARRDAKRIEELRKSLGL